MKINENIDTDGAFEDNDTFRRQKHEKWNTPLEIVNPLVLEATGSAATKYERIINGETNEVYFVTTETGKEIVVRIQHGERNKFQKERWALERCAENGVPVPVVLLVRSVETDSGVIHVCIESKLEGIGLDSVPDIHNLDNAESAEILRQLGVVLEKIHSIPVSGLGKLNDNGEGKFASVSEMVADEINLKRNFVLQAFVGRSEDLTVLESAFAVLQKEADRFSEVKPCLIHNDLSPSHILVHDGKISGIIDFESCCAADSVQEYALWDFKFGQKYPLKTLGINCDIAKLNYWKIYRAFTSLNYCLKENKESGVKRALSVIRESLKYFQ
jgi:aminoglycoside phosphotransferase (APT) family kinase protein